MDKAIWKPSGEWSCFVGNILVGVKDVSTYQQKKKGVYIYLVIYIYIYIILFLNKCGFFFL